MTRKLVAELREVQLELEESRNRYAELYDFAPIGYVTLDGLGRIEEINMAGATMIGRPRRLVLGSPFSLYLVREDIAKFMTHLFRCKMREVRVETEVRLKSSGPNTKSVQLSTTPGSTMLRKGVVLYQTAITDLTERDALDRVVHEAQQMLEVRVRQRTSELFAANTELENEIALRRRLEGEVLAIVDREQRRLGQNLHDGLCQHLTAVAFMVRALSERFRSQKALDPSELDEIASLVNDGVADARKIAHGLDPINLDSGGLMSALEQLVAQKHLNVRCRLIVKKDVSISDQTVALHLYRIAREALINASKHARAREVILRMDSSRKGIVLTVADDGIGFSRTGNNSRGMGFHIMDYRARAIGAQLEIKAGAKGGTEVVCVLPRK